MNPRTSRQLLDDEFPVMRAKVLELAAALDRIDRADGPPAAGVPLATLHAAIETLLRPGEDRAEQVQLLFSRTYEEDWRKTMEV